MATVYDRTELFWERVDMLYDTLGWRTWSVPACFACIITSRTWKNAEQAVLPASDQYCLTRGAVYCFPTCGTHAVLVPVSVHVAFIWYRTPFRARLQHLCH